MISLNYEALIKYVNFLEISNKLIDKARLRWIKIAAQGMSIKASQLKLLSAFRGRCTHYWNGGNLSQLLAAGDGINEHPLVDVPVERSIGLENLQDLKDIYCSFSDENAIIRAAIKSHINVALTQLSWLDSTRSQIMTSETVPLASAIPARSDNGGFDSSIPTLRAVYKRVTEYRRGDEDVTDLEDQSNTETAMPDVQPLDFIVDETIDLSLNADQAEAMKLCLQYYNSLERSLQDSGNHPTPEPLQLVIMGRAGSGKTYFIKKLQEAIHRPGAILCTAFTGVAATLLPIAYTVHSAFGFKLEDNSAKANFVSSLTNPIQRPMSGKRAQSARFRFAKDLRFLIIDEFSMLPAHLLVNIDDRLRHWTEKPLLPFGGVSVILMGDEFQLFPVGMSLITASLDIRNQAGQLFNRFRRLHFHNPERSGDPVLNAALEFFRDTTCKHPVVSSGILNLLAPLRRSDTADPLWLDATIVVPGNEQRYAINLSRAVAMATRTGQPVIAWKLPLHPDSVGVIESIALRHETTSKKLLEDENETTVFFVKGANAIVCENIATDLRIANGTRCIMHSILLNPSSAEFHWEKIRQVAPGDIYWLPDDATPLYLNVEFVNLSEDEWNPLMTIVPGSVVIPMPLCERNRCKLAKTLDLASCKCCYYNYGIELAFAVTFYKVQGCTLDRIILDLNHVGGHSKTVDLSSLYVGLSRVRKFEHIRVLPITGTTREFLSGLRFKDALVRWCLNAPQDAL
jgi:hypothetical protein